MIEFRLPSLGADMDEGKLLEWRVQPGDTVKKGQVVCVVDTAKAAIDLADYELLLKQLKAAAAQSPQPELHIRGDKAVRYERVAIAMAAAQQAGIKKIGFITEPKS